MTPKSPGGRPYPITLQWDESSDGYSGWVAAIDALPGCVSQGETPKEAVDSLAEVTEDWIRIAQKRGMTVPEPRDTAAYSGRFLVRAPNSLHERLVQEAAAEGVSLNQFVTNALGAAVGWRVPQRSAGSAGSAAAPAASGSPAAPAGVDPPAETGLLNEEDLARELGLFDAPMQCEFMDTAADGLFFKLKFPKERAAAEASSTAESAAPQRRQRQQQRQAT